jgi:hypothetical protein
VIDLYGSQFAKLAPLSAVLCNSSFERWLRRQP